MSSELHDAILPRGGRSPDRVVAEGLVDIANRTTRRHFIAWVGRASVSLLGAGYLSLWKQEAAYAACNNSNGPFAYSDRSTCMCSEVIGGSCPNCCSGWWDACPTNENNPAGCFVPCHLNPPLRQAYRVRLFDCCAKCSGQSTLDKPGCSNFGDNWCVSEGYCEHGCGTFEQGWRVKCVIRECRNIKCGTIYQTCN